MMPWLCCTTPCRAMLCYAWLCYIMTCYFITRAAFQGPCIPPPLPRRVQLMNPKPQRKHENPRKQHPTTLSPRFRTGHECLIENSGLNSFSSYKMVWYTARPCCKLCSSGINTACEAEPLYFQHPERIPLQQGAAL